MKSSIRRDITVKRTPRFMQICGKFDLSTNATSVQEWETDIKLPAEWSVGVIVGPSMAGKSTIAAELFTGELVNQGDWAWPTDMCIADGFAEGMSIDDITGLLSRVGFSSPPDWKKPYHALSNGGKFRVDLARTLAERPARAVIDEFGSIVHAQARQVAAAAAASAVRRRGGQLVALCVHPDAVPYFEPDWVIDITPGQRVLCEHTRGRLRRPDIGLEIVRVHRKAWALFAPHHYLAHSIHNNAACFIGLIAGEPATFTAVMHAPTSKGLSYREHRTVCLPTFQGIGLGNATSEYVASLYRATGVPYYSSTSHPAFIRHRAKSKLWAMIRKPGLTSGSKGFKDAEKYKRATASSRITAGFRYVGPARPEEAAAFGIIPVA